MHHQAILHYTEQLVSRAVCLYWKRTVGVGLLIALALMVALLVWSLSGGDRSWVVGLLAAVVILGALMPLVVYVVHYRNSIRKFREMNEPVAEFVAGYETFTLSSDLGVTTLKWASIREIWRSEHCWLLLFSQAQFVTLPTGDISEPMRTFILERVSASGGKIAD